ncbi:MAG TPA: hypothetical protein VNI01_02540, partial [Elusimicrobiota bacterium]|nr:hypothetical protein [Elusimicrobiota bacterium]
MGVRPRRLSSLALLLAVAAAVSCRFSWAVVLGEAGAAARPTVFVAAPGQAGRWMDWSAAAPDLLSRGLESALGDLSAQAPGAAPAASLAAEPQARELVPGMESVLAREVAAPEAGRQDEIRARASFHAFLAQALTDPELRGQLVQRLSGGRSEALSARIERIAASLQSDPEAARAVGAFAERVRSALQLPGLEGLGPLFDASRAGLRDVVAGGGAVQTGAGRSGLTGSQLAALSPAGTLLRPAETLFRPGIERPAEARAEQLEGVARDVARLRETEPGLLSEQERAVLRGVDDLRRMAEIGRTTPEQLAQDAAVLDAMSDEQVAALTELAHAFLRPDAGPGPVAANWEHVNLQHLTPEA